MASRNSSGNALEELNGALIFQMNRLMDAKDEQLEVEINRSREVSKLAGSIISNHSNAIRLWEMQVREGLNLDSNVIMPKMLGGGS